MNPEIPILARRVAARLASELAPDLQTAVEQELAAQRTKEAMATRRSLTFDAGTSIALAGFLLAAVQFGWNVWRDLKKDRERTEEATPPRQLLVRRLRLELDPPPGLPASGRDRVLDAVADEILQG